MGYYTVKQSEKRKRQNNRKASVGRSGKFMAWDGEGYDVNGRHQYVMLCNDHGKLLGDATGLTTESLLTALCDAGLCYSDYNHVMFGGSYDANMMLRDLDSDTVTQLATSGVCHWRDWRIEYRPRKYLRISQYEKFAYHNKANKIATITLWDVIGFFQSSFVKALEAWLSEDAETMDFIQSMKTRRSQFSSDDFDVMATYCVRECELLVQMMTTMRNYMRQVDIAPTRWDGAGALAQAMLKRERIKQYKSTDENLPSGVHEAAKHAYFGGRIEMVRYGNHEGPVYAHDIVSAYPAAMVDLPCLAHGEWIYELNNLDSVPPLNAQSFAMVHVKWNIDRIDLPFYPLPHRATTGEVYFPPTGEGWYWTPEVIALQKYVEHYGGKAELLEWYWFWCKCILKPFDFIQPIFDYRKQLKARGHKGEKVLKLALNSLYGKLAQQVGGRDGHGPAYHQLEWAGYITSLTRAKMLTLALRNPNDVIAFETDGLYSTAPYTRTGDEVNTGTLGTWDFTQYGGITYAQSGVYWVLSDGEWKAKYRGLDPSTISRQLVLHEWNNPSPGHAYRIANEGIECFINGPHIHASAHRFRGMMTSVISPERFVYWRQWCDDPKTVRLYPHGKRVRSGDAHNPADRLIITQATGGGGMSAPHKLAWEDPTVKSLEDPYYLSDQTGDEAWDGR